MNSIQVLIVCVSIILFHLQFLSAGNIKSIKCYQCVRNSTEPCPEEALMQCPSVANSCIKETSSDESRGLMIKRECAIGPCWKLLESSYKVNDCDPKRKDFLCISCCTGDGCNSAYSSRSIAGGFVSILLITLILIMCKT